MAWTVEWDELAPQVCFEARTFPRGIQVVRRAVSGASMNMREAEVELGKAIELMANPIGKDLGLLFRREDNRIYVADSTHYRVRIILEWATIVTMIEPTTPASDGTDYPKTQLEIGWVNTPEDISGEVERQIAILRDFLSS